MLYFNNLFLNFKRLALIQEIWLKIGRHKVYNMQNWNFRVDLEFESNGFAIVEIKNGWTAVVLKKSEKWQSFQNLKIVYLWLIHFVMYTFDKTVLLFVCLFVCL